MVCWRLDDFDCEITQSQRVENSCSSDKLSAEAASANTVPPAEPAVTTSRRKNTRRNPRHKIQNVSPYPCAFEGGPPGKFRIEPDELPPVEKGRKSRRTDFVELRHIFEEEATSSAASVSKPDYLEGFIRRWKNGRQFIRQPSQNLDGVAAVLPHRFNKLRRASCIVFARPEKGDHRHTQKKRPKQPGRRLAEITSIATTREEQYSQTA